MTQQKIPIYQIDAFASRPFEGNPAAVCPLEEWLPDAVLQDIAAENNLAETAFYVPVEKGYHLRWFTPTTEVDLCGHATLAAAHVILKSNGMSEVSFHSRSGRLRVLRSEDRLTLDFPADPAHPCSAPEALIEGLGMTPTECYAASDYMAVFEDEATILSLRPDFRKLMELDLRGVIVTAPGMESDFVSRFFVPNYGIDEDPVTGAIHCTLTPFWANQFGKRDLTAIQRSKRTGRLSCRLMDDRVHISGRTVEYLEGHILVPA